MFKPLFFYKCSFLHGGGRSWIQKAQRWKPPNPVFHLSISVPNLQLSAAQYLNDVWGWAKPTPRTRDNLHRGKIWENKHAATKHYQIPVEFIGCSLKVNIRLLEGGRDGGLPVFMQAVSRPFLCAGPVTFLLWCVWTAISRAQSGSAVPRLHLQRSFFFLLLTPPVFP